MFRIARSEIYGMAPLSRGRQAYSLNRSNLQDLKQRRKTALRTFVSFFHNNLDNTRPDTIPGLTTTTNSKAPSTLTSTPATSTSTTSPIYGPSSWPEDDGASSPILLNRRLAGTGKFYPKNRLRIVPFPHIAHKKDWIRFRFALNKRLLGMFSVRNNGNINEKVLLKVRLKDDDAPGIINDRQSMRWGDQELFFHPLEFVPKNSVEEDETASVGGKRLVIKNLCFGWLKKELDAVIDQGLRELELKGSYSCDLGEGKTKICWMDFTFYEFEFEEDANKVIDRYGSKAVIENPGSGLIFENCELWIGKARPKSVKSDQADGGQVK
jgi:hypothetical protein